MKYIVILLVIALVVCASKWLSYWISSAALLLYIQGKEYTLPSEEEMKACMKAVIQNATKYGFKGK